MKKKPFLILGLLCSFLFFSGTAHAASDEALQIWNWYDIEKKIGDHWNLKIGEELRFSDNVSLFQRYATYAEIRYQLFPFFSVSGEYKHIRDKKKGKWVWEYRPRIKGVFKVKWEGFTLKNQNRIDFRMKESAKDTIRYTNKTMLDLPFKWTRFEIQPTVSNEIFIESRSKGMTRDRFSTGLKFHLVKALYGGIYYIRQADKDSKGKWKESNIIATSLKLKF